MKIIDKHVSDEMLYALTYKNYRNEFLFELVGVCAECHRRLHDQGGER